MKKISKIVQIYCKRYIANSRVGAKQVLIIPPLGDIYHYWASAKTQKVIPSKEIIEWAKSQKGGV